MMPSVIAPSICLSVQGMQGKGKTHFAFSAPGPIGYLNFDDGWQRVRPNFPNAEIHMTTFEVPEFPAGTSPDDVQRLCAPVYNQFKETFALYLGTMRTVVVDTMTSAWALARLAYLGTQGGVKGKQYAYSPVNEDFRRVLRLRRKSPQTIVQLLHREGDEWAGDAKTGKNERKGFTEIAFEVDDLIQCYIDGKEFKIKMLESKTRPSLTGKVYSSAEATFQNIAVDLYPQTMITDWL